MIIIKKLTLKFEIFVKEDMQRVILAAVTWGTTAESAQTLQNLSEPDNAVGEARLLLNHGQQYPADARLACIGHENNTRLHFNPETIHTIPQPTPPHPSFCQPTSTPTYDLKWCRPFAT